ncbi:tetratricopeptide repeat protein [Massilia aerilata]|uniref:Tetratricopeptide repeat protein n=1 Tax=Massilia aerilata TaxID=453817 RepID=A0ABW0S6N3_9BURK
MRHLVAILLVLLAGCASTPKLPPTPDLYSDASFKPPSAPVSTAELFTLSPEMRDYLHSAAFQSYLRNRGKEYGLLEALYNGSKSGLKLDYDATYTRNAAETYRDRAGNCMSLVIMTAAFAKELGMTVRYQSVLLDESWSRGGGLYLLSGHVNLLLGYRAPDQLYGSDPERALVVDFLPDPRADKRYTQQLEEDEILMMYQNNRAAEALVEGKVDDAYWWARAATASNPRTALAYNTLGVVYERHGDLTMAERAYRAALMREPQSVIALRNIEPVLMALGKTEEAKTIAQRVAKIEPVAPFQYFNKGIAAYQQGEFGEARDLFAREVKRAPYYDEFHFWLAASLIQLGELKQAREQLALAADTSTKKDTRNIYNAKLAHLRQLGMR